MFASNDKNMDILRTDRFEFSTCMGTAKRDISN